MSVRTSNTIKLQLDPLTWAGTLITRIELSALPETKIVEVVLKAKVVGGNSCAFNMAETGLRVEASSKPTLRSEDPYPSNFPSGLIVKQVIPRSPTFRDFSIVQFSVFHFAR